MNSAQFIPAAILILLGWRIALRFRRSVGRQRLRPARLMVRIALLALVTGIATFVALPNLVSLESELAGLAVGVALAFLGLKLTRFEITQEGNFYVPNTYLGIALTLLLVGRIAYRFFTIASGPGGLVAPDPTLWRSPLTLLVFGVTAGYYLAYSAGILLRGRKFVGARAVA